MAMKFAMSWYEVSNQFFFIESFTLTTNFMLFWGYAQSLKFTNLKINNAFSNASGFSLEVRTFWNVPLQVEVANIRIFVAALLPMTESSTNCAGIFCRSPIIAAQAWAMPAQGQAKQHSYDDYEQRRCSWQWRSNGWAWWVCRFRYRSGLDATRRGCK